MSALPLQGSIEQLLVQFNVDPADLGSGVSLPTAAGELHFVMLDDAVHLDFMDVDHANQAIASGELDLGSLQLNADGSGFVLADDDAAQDALVDLFRLLASESKPDEVVQSYLASLKALGADADVNTSLTYMYRDGDNYKTSRTIEFQGALTSPGALNAFALAFDASDCDWSFIPGQMGLADLQDSFGNTESRWDPERDHPWHVVTSITAVDAQIDSGDEMDDRSIDVFAKALCKHVLTQGWDGNFKPECYEAMKARYDRYAAEQV